MMVEDFNLPVGLAGLCSKIEKVAQILGIPITGAKLTATGFLKVQGIAIDADMQNIFDRVMSTYGAQSRYICIYCGTTRAAYKRIQEKNTPVLCGSCYLVYINEEARYDDF